MHDHPNRRRLLGLVQERPGIHLHALVAEARLGNGNTRHHLRVLVAAGLVTTRRAGRRLHCFPSDGFDEADWRALAVRADPKCRRLADLVASLGPARWTDVVDAAQLCWSWSPSTTQERLRRLVEHGVVAPPQRPGGAYRLA